MIVAGIDVGGKTVQIAIMKEDQILAAGASPTGIKKAEAVEARYNHLLKEAGLTRKDVECVIATGSGAKRVVFADGIIGDAAADTLGVIKLFPSARTIVDVGAEEARAIKVDSDGNILDFAVNDKCAAGTGMFVEAMARALEVSVDELGKIALDSTQAISINAQCAVFGESEVVSLIHQKINKSDISRAVMDAIAGRTGSLARIVGLEKDLLLIGGMAKNTGFVDSLKKVVEIPVIVPEGPEFFGAFGAAEAALRRIVPEEPRSNAPGRKSVSREKAQPGE